MTGSARVLLNSVLFASVQPEHVARVLDDRDLHAEADAEIGHAALARVAHGLDLALDAALAEAARHQDRVHALEQPRAMRSMSVDST